MNEAYYGGQRICQETLRQLTQRDNHPAVAQFLTDVTLVVGSGVWTVLSWNGPWWNLILSQVSFAIMVCGTFACLHESAHGTAFASKRWNQGAAFIAGLFHLYPSSLFRELHFTHHRHTHVPGLDPEISLGNRPAPAVLGNLPMYLGWLTGLPLLMFKIGMLVTGALGMPEILRANLYPFVRPKLRRSIALESAIVLSFHGVLLLLAIYVYNGFWGPILGQVIGHCLLAAYVTPEHNGLPHEGGVLEKTRSIDTNRWVKRLMWNMPFHAEHHAFPAVPFHALPQLRQHIEAEVKHRPPGYSQFHIGVLQGDRQTIHGSERPIATDNDAS